MVRLADSITSDRQIMSPTPQERRQPAVLRRLPAVLGHGADGGPLQARPALLPQPGLRPPRGGGVHGAV